MPGVLCEQCVASGRLTLCTVGHHRPGSADLKRARTGRKGISARFRKWVWRRTTAATPDDVSCSAVVELRGICSSRLVRRWGRTALGLAEPLLAFEQNDLLGSEVRSQTSSCPCLGAGRQDRPAGPCSRSSRAPQLRPEEVPEADPQEDLKRHMVHVKAKAITRTVGGMVHRGTCARPVYASNLHSCAVLHVRFLTSRFAGIHICCTPSPSSSVPNLNESKLEEHVRPRFPSPGI